jgi:hypothetical protein
LFHNPTFAPGGIVLSAVDILFALANVSLSLSDLELAFEDFFGTRATPARRC